MGAGAAVERHEGWKLRAVLKESDTLQCHGTIASVGATMWNAVP